MSSIDIICIPETTFYQYQNATSVNDKTTKMYESLIAEHACFSVTYQPYEPQNPRQGNKQRSHRPQHHSLGFAVRSNSFGTNTSKRPKKPNEDPLAVFKGLLNVLNTSNFDKIQRKFKMAITDTNMLLVCHLVLETATQQAFFIDIYIRLLNGCRLSYPQINHIISDFVNEYMAKEEFVPGDVIPTDFVEQQKMKKQVIGKVILITELLKIKLPSISTTHQLFVYSIMHNLQQTNDMQITDLLLSSLHEVKKRCKVILDNNILKDLMFKHSDTRILFMFEQLL